MSVDDRIVAMRNILAESIKDGKLEVSTDVLEGWLKDILQNAWDDGYDHGLDDSHYSQYDEDSEDEEG